MTSTDISPEVEAVLHMGLNKPTLTCLHCSSKILHPNVARYIQKEFALPSMTQLKDKTEVEKHISKDFWQVSDIYNFENIGFSHSVDGVKYLTCADCEMGPIGWHDLQTKESYVAMSRVRNVLMS